MRKSAFTWSQNSPTSNSLFCRDHVTEDMHVSPPIQNLSRQIDQLIRFLALILDMYFKRCNDYKYYLVKIFLYPCNFNTMTWSLQSLLYKYPTTYKLLVSFRMGTQEICTRYVPTYLDYTLVAIDQNQNTITYYWFRIKVPKLPYKTIHES